MQIGYIGLGKMGLAMVARLLEKGYRVVAWNRSIPSREEARKLGAATSDTIEGMCQMLPLPRLIWVMLPHGVVGEVLKDMLPFLSEGDTVIDGGNSFFRKSQYRAKELAHCGIHFLDVGVSGGPSGARNGACLMIGGDKKIFRRHEQLFQDLSASPSRSVVLENNRTRRTRGKEKDLGGSYAYVGKSGAGHFVKMVHNGIEYGMMQALAEGFNLLRAADERGFRSHADVRGYKPQMNADEGADERGNESEFRLDLEKIAELYNHGSVIESRLVGWLAKALKEHGVDLKDISGEVAHSGEGQWTVETAKELGVPVEIIEKSLQFRIQSKGNETFTGKVVNALRNQFGGHSITNNQQLATNDKEKK